MFNLFRKNNLNKYELFWQWFSENEKAIYKMVDLDDHLLDKLSKQLKRIAPPLTFELSHNEGVGKREFIISADGLREFFPEVEALVEKAPEYTNWKIIAFRPRMKIVGTLNLEGVDFDQEKSFFKLYKADSGKVNIRIWLSASQDENIDNHLFRMGGYILLDSILGEYDVETKIAGIEFLKIGENNEEDKISLSELAKEFDKHF